jgi:hypothetical protein
MTPNMTLVDVSTNDLTGMALDITVAQFDKRCTGLTWVWIPAHVFGHGFFEGRGQLSPGGSEEVCVYIAQRGVLDVARAPHLVGVPRYAPSSMWTDAGHLVDEYRINFVNRRVGSDDEYKNESLLAKVGRTDLQERHRPVSASTYTLAACRAVVAAMGGDIVKVPACAVLP